MPGHVFDTNVLKNFLTTGLISVLAEVCPVPRRVPSSVWTTELPRLRDGFLELHRDLQPEELARYLERLHAYAPQLVQHGFAEVNVLTGSSPEEQALLTCLLDEDRIGAGEAECLAIAAYRGDDCYSDDLAFKRQVDAINDEEATCPPYGVDRPPRLPITVHGTVRLLLQAMDKGLLKLDEAEQHFGVMRDRVGSRLPAGTLAELRGGPHDW